VAAEVVSLPMFPELTDTQVEFIAESAKKALRA
jgi:dTDP-4-amino-4,6-dideoxygalactose transaminase